jgi:EAL domain-containing protein (putative c-di-GMP-specific phosphodiesterase class I)
VALGDALNIDVNAEGVETEAHAAFVRSLGCEEMQGFLFSQPIPATQLGAFILTNFGTRLRGATVSEPPAAAGG